MLAYYIAAINIEAVYHSLVGGDYVPFEGICLTDTFQMYEKEDLINELLVDNSARRTRQKNLDIRVIVGNPPYSAGQASANDNNQNVEYPFLDGRIRSTYAERSTATNKNGLYDSYIRAIRWASDRIGSSGVIGFVTNANFLEGGTFDGLRQCLADEFSSIYVFHLRGNGRTSGERCRREGHPLFAAHGGRGGSLTPIAITLLVKNPEATDVGKIYFHNVGDYLKRGEKLAKIAEFTSIAGIAAADGWQTIRPDEHGDWLNQRDDRFSDYIVLGSKDVAITNKLFSTYSRGLETNRDAWCYNSAENGVIENMSRMIGFYNNEVDRFNQTHHGLDKKLRETKVDGFISTDPTKISWNRSLKQDLSKSRRFKFDVQNLVPSMYRPYTKQWVYYHRNLNAYVNHMPRIFPNATTENRAICINAVGAQKDFSALITNHLPDLHLMQTGQCFPLYLYEDAADEYDADVPKNADLFEALPPATTDRKRRDALTDEGFAHFQAAYPSEQITKEDVFYYVYGLLHSPDYLERYADNLTKELPRIPCVKTTTGFWSFSKAGRALAELHINYETVEPYQAKIEGNPAQSSDYRVEKMKYGKKGKDKDLTTLHYNAKITVTGIPLEAYEYVVNGKPALDWVVERQCVKTDKASGIVNDANAWAIETMNNPKYPLELFLRMITVSLETMKIVKSLPSIDI
ncbi:type ISP restriction/modification enzyme [Pseudomonas agarici]|uniref:type ISP restriction/modification enzyme n=1 Tax=Pseudomonas agarici TaxID=46677 RepID=UPI0008C3AEED|nr:hypothetical protein SAMN05216604_104137 [Pseudomonas agarici]